MTEDGQGQSVDTSAPQSGTGRAAGDSRLRMLSRFALDLFEIPTEAELFDYVVREAAVGLGLSSCRILLLDAARCSFKPAASYGATADVFAEPVSVEIAAQPIESGPAISRGCADCADSGFWVPLTVDDETIGALYSVNAWAGRFGAEDQEVLSTVAAMTGARLGLLRKDTALRASEEDFRSLFETASAGIGRSDLATGRIIRANRKLAEIFGYGSHEELMTEFSVGNHYVHLADRERLIESIREAPGVPVEIHSRRMDGRAITTLVYAAPNEDAETLNFAIVDITEIRQLESELQQQRALVQALIQHSPVAISIRDLEGRIKFISTSFCRYLGVSAEEAVGHLSAEFITAETLRLVDEADRKVKRTGRALESDEAFTVKIGPATLLLTKFPIHDASGEITAIATVGIDITERKLTEDRLRQSERQLSEAARIAKLGSWEVRADGMLSWSAETFRMFGVSPEEFDGTSSKAFYDRVHPDDREMVRRESEEVRRTGARFDCVHRIVRPDGAVLTVREGAEVVYEPDGDLLGMFGAGQDITEAVAIETQLLQAQKMEAVGQLTGGVAHDFNNLLMIVQGNAELLAERPEVDRSLVEAIIRAAGRGAELTSRLLSFSRCQALNPRPIDLARLLAGMKTLLERSLGETIEIDIVPCAHASIARADPGQVENAILNLALNARDAMPRGGKLTIECAELTLDDASAQHPDLAPSS